MVNVRANSGDIWIPVTDEASLPEGIGKLAEAVIQNEPIQKEEKTTVEEVREQKVEKTEEAEPAKPTKQPEEKDASDPEHSRQYEEGRIAGLQEAILAIMEKNGPVTDQMRRDVRENVYHDSLIAWIKSFR